MKKTSFCLQKLACINNCRKTLKKRKHDIMHQSKNIYLNLLNSDTNTKSDYVNFINVTDDVHMTL